jgi:hypothetical protein
MADRINLDDIIARLIEVKDFRPGRAVNLTEAEVMALIEQS